MIFDIYLIPYIYILLLLYIIISSKIRGKIKGSEGCSTRYFYIFIYFIKECWADLFTFCLVFYPNPLHHPQAHHYPPFLFPQILILLLSHIFIPLSNILSHIFFWSAFGFFLPFLLPYSLFPLIKSRIKM